MRTTLNEFFFVAQLIQNLYTLHLFIILVYSILPETMQSVRMERFFIQGAWDRYRSIFDSI